MSLTGKINNPTKAIQKGLVAVSGRITGTGSTPTVEGPFNLFYVGAGAYVVARSGAKRLLAGGPPFRTHGADEANYLGAITSCSEEGFAVQTEYGNAAGLGGLDIDGLYLIAYDQVADSNADIAAGEEIHFTMFYRRSVTGG